MCKSDAEGVSRALRLKATHQSASFDELGVRTCWQSNSQRRRSPWDAVTWPSRSAGKTPACEYPPNIPAPINSASRAAAAHRGGLTFYLSTWIYLLVMAPPPALEPSHQKYDIPGPGGQFVARDQHTASFSCHLQITVWAYMGQSHITS